MTTKPICQPNSPIIPSKKKKDKVSNFIADLYPYIKSDEYKKKKDPVLQSILLKRKLQKYRGDVRAAIDDESGNRKAQERYGFNPQAMYRFSRLQDFAKKAALDEYLDIYEEPPTKEGYDYRILLELGRREQQKVMGEARAD